MYYESAAVSRPLKDSRSNLKQIISLKIILDEMGLGHFATPCAAFSGQEVLVARRGFTLHTLFFFYALGTLVSISYRC